MGFQLKIITPNGEFFNGEVDKFFVKTAMGNIGVLRRHIPLVAPVEISRIYLHIKGEVKVCAIAGGILYVEADKTRILANACEYQDKIDIKRAEEAAERARARLATKDGNIDIARAGLALRRALNRINTVRQPNE